MDHTDEIKKRIDIVDFIGQYLQLKKAGVNYSALCPFHSEKTPSFMVSPERQSFKCFGCNEGGDVITFFMKMEGFAFSEALRILGERVGVQVSFKPKEEVDREKTKRDRIFKINLLAAKYYKAVLNTKEGKPVLDYLLNRKISKETIEKLKIGWAPQNNKLDQYFAKYGFSYSEIALAGHPERFRYRIIFPIFDVLGNVIGFSGRILESVLPKGVSPHPKYLNTPETPVFHKSRALYGLNLAKDSIRKNKRAVVVEGQMDVAASIEAGVFEAVASSGTALTREHLKILGRYTPNIIFAFDEDEAGQKAAHAAVGLAYDEALEPHLTIIKDYKDVGELVEENKNAWAKILSDALPPVEWLVKKTRDKLSTDEMSAETKKNLVKSALQFIARQQDEIEKAHYMGYLARTVGVPEISIEKAFLKQKAPADTKSQQMQKTNDDFESDFISFLLNFPQLAKTHKLKEGLSFSNKEYPSIYRKLMLCYNGDKVQECIATASKEIPQNLRQTIDSSLLVWDQKISEDKEAASSRFGSIYRRLAEQSKEDLKKNFASRIAAAESAGDIEKVKKLMRELQEGLKNNADN